MKRLDSKKAFTLIELLVVIAVLAILVLLAAPRFLGHTEKALHTSLIHNAKLIQDASERYHLDEDDWPRLTDDPYSAEEIESFAEKIYGITGKEVNLDPDGNYYDIDYDKLSEYVQVPDNKENYILQNPVGKVYYMENLTEVGVARVNYSSAKEEDDNSIGGEIAIDSAEKLAKIGNPGEPKYPLDGEYILTSDIDLSGYSKEEGWTPIGSYTSNTNKNPFTGTFDGNGYKIANLTINRSTENYVGLFGYTEGAIIKNVALEGVNVRGKGIVGGLVGRARSGTISNSYATGEVTGSGGVGGLAGEAYSSTISNSYATGAVTGSGFGVGGFVGRAGSITIENSYATGSVTGSDNHIGGLVGVANSSTITNSYATGSVTGTSYVGGLVGETSNSTKITNSYATGSVTGSGSEVGGFTGAAWSNTTIRNSYWDKGTTGQTKSGGGTGKSTSEMKRQTTYSGWDFTNVWEITTGNYPTLR